MITLTNIPRDVVALLPGGEVTIVLRPISEADQYTYIAEFFIHGFMDGECLVDARNPAQSEDGPTEMRKYEVEYNIVHFPPLLPYHDELGLISMAVYQTAFATILTCQIQPFENPSDRSWPMYLEIANML